MRKAGKYIREKNVKIILKKRRKLKSLENSKKSPKKKLEKIVSIETEAYKTKSSHCELKKILVIFYFMDKDFNFS